MLLCVTYRRRALWRAGLADESRDQKSKFANRVDGRDERGVGVCVIAMRCSADPEEHPTLLRERHAHRMGHPSSWIEE